MNRFRLMLLGLVALIGVLPAHAQYTTVTATVTDSQGTAWANGTCTALYAAVPNFPGPLTNGATGQTIDPNPATCTLNGSGVMSIQLVQTKYVYGPGGPSAGNSPGVIFTACPQIHGAACYSTAPIVITGATQSVSTQINAVIQAPVVSGLSPLAQAYNDGEVTVGASQSNQYFNLTTHHIRCYTSGSWADCGTGGGGGGTPGGLQGNPQFNAGSSTFGGIPTVFVPASADATGATDAAAINAVLAANKIAEICGTYYINAEIQQTTSIGGIRGCSPYYAVINTVSATQNGIHIVNTGTGLIGGTYSDFSIQAKSGVTPTAGALFKLEGPNGSPSCSSTGQITGLNIRDINLSGFRAWDWEGCIFNNNITDVQAGVSDATSGCGLINAVDSSGDNNVTNYECATGNLLLTHLDTNAWTNLKLHSGRVVVDVTSTGPNAVRNQRFINASIEDGSGALCAYNFNWTNPFVPGSIQIIGGEVGFGPKELVCENGSIATYNNEGHTKFYTVIGTIDLDGTGNSRTSNQSGMAYSDLWTYNYWGTWGANCTGIFPACGAGTPGFYYTSVGSQPGSSSAVDLGQVGTGGAFVNDAHSWVVQYPYLFGGEVDIMPAMNDNSAHVASDAVYGLTERADASETYGWGWQRGSLSVGTGGSSNSDPGLGNAYIQNQLTVGSCVGCTVPPIQITVGTTTVNANSCDGGHTATATGLTTTSGIKFTPATDFHSTTGWSAGGTSLYFYAWPTANTVNYFVCNSTSSNITPGASTTWNVSF